MRSNELDPGKPNSLAIMAAKKAFLADSEKRLKVEISGLREQMVGSDLNVRDDLKADIADLRGPGN